MFNKADKDLPIRVVAGFCMIIAAWSIATLFGVGLANLVNLKPVAGCTLGGFAAGWVANWIVRDARRR
jgi:hypothetical protein